EILSAGIRRLFGLSRSAKNSKVGQSLRGGDVTRDDLGHLQVVCFTSLTETFRNTGAIAHVAILAHLPLALEPRDRTTEADDSSQHRLYERLGRIRGQPWLGFAPLLLSGKLSHVAVQPLLLSLPSPADNHRHGRPHNSMSARPSRAEPSRGTSWA